MGPERTVGGLSRTFGLQRRAEGEEPGPAPLLRRARPGRVARYLAPYWRQWAVVFGCVAAVAALGTLPPLCVRAILDDAIPGRDERLLHLLVAAIIGLHVVAGLIGVLQNYVNTRVGQAITFDLRNALYRRLQGMSLSFYAATRSGEIVSRVNNDVGAVQGAVSGTLVSIVTNLCAVGATAAVLFALNWRLALLALAVVPVLYFPTRFVGRIRQRLSRQTQERQADLLSFLQERLQMGGMLLTKLFGQGEADAEAFQRRNREVMDLNVRQAMAGRWLFLCLTVFSVTGPALIYGYGGYQAIRQQISVGTLIAFVAYLAQLYRPIANLSHVYVDVRGALAVFERIFEYLDLKPEVEDRSGARALDAVRGHLRFEGVGFVYPARRRAGGGKAAPAGAGPEEGPSVPRGAPGPSPGHPPGRPFALADLSFEVLPGDRVALVGRSGAGKTTVTHLVPRLFDPTAGRVTLDGTDLREVNQESLRRHIGVVTQETFLFHATLRENLLYARPEARDEELVAAARAANIHEFIAGLPDGYDTVVGERGFRLSGGERQRIAIARALLKDPRILILDEATSSLDAATEALIQEALETLLRGRTSLVIAHRLSTILHADRILVLDEGRLVESGPHADLVAAGGLYAGLYRRQFDRAAAAAAG